MVACIIGAACRAMLVMVLLLTPSLLLPGVSVDTILIVTLLGLIFALLVMYEYSSDCPGITDFRNAPPFNRIRFATLFSIVYVVSLLLDAASEGVTLIAVLRHLGETIYGLANVPFGPIDTYERLVSTHFESQSRGQTQQAIGVSICLSAFAMIGFAYVVRATGWPKLFGVGRLWTNLPTFDPAIGQDVVARLLRDARLNLLFGLSLPYLVPVLASAACHVLDVELAPSAHSQVWMIAIWAYLPTNFVLKSMAIFRLAYVLERHKGGASASTARSFAPV